MSEATTYRRELIFDLHVFGCSTRQISNYVTSVGMKTSIKRVRDLIAQETRGIAREQASIEYHNKWLASHAEEWAEEMRQEKAEENRKMKRHMLLLLNKHYHD